MENVILIIFVTIVVVVVIYLLDGFPNFIISLEDGVIRFIIECFTKGKGPKVAWKNFKDMFKHIDTYF